MQLGCFIGAVKLYITIKKSKFFVLRKFGPESKLNISKFCNLFCASVGISNNKRALIKQC